MTQPIISIQNISKHFGGTRALNEVSFDVMPGELHAICGENGAGKSTLMKILSGVITSYDGELAVDGKTVHFTGTRDAESVGISIIHQELNLVEQLSIAANIVLGRE
ncbi:MAG: ATP-binding cassette domain-containing protein, partial [Pirellula sp.]